MKRPTYASACSARAAMFAFACLCSANAAHALEPDVLFSKVSPSVWSVRTFDAQERRLQDGSAVVVAPGRLVTTCQVLAKASSFVVRRDNVTYGATLESPDPARDLCLIKVANFPAPAVVVAAAGSSRIGQRVYVVASPRAIENTLSEGMLTGLRGGDDADARLLQTTVAVPPGSSGGGLFDAEGRLVGIANAGPDDGAVANAGPSSGSAIPAEFLADIPSRAVIAMAARSTEASQSSNDGATRPVAVQTPLRPGDALEYVRVDKLTGLKSPVIYRLDRISGGELLFNNGGRVEKADGRVVSITSPAGGIYDSSSPPGGWGRPNIRPGMRWYLDYVAPSGDKWRHELNATVAAEQSMRVDGNVLRVVQINYEGWIYASYGTGSPPIGTPFEAKAWYSVEQGRVIRFEAKHRRGYASVTEETLELVRVLR